MPSLSATGEPLALRALLRANQVIVGDLSLPVLLRRIVQAACDLSGARYGALGVTGEHGGVEQFVHLGMSAEDVTRIDHLPEGKGLLGALIADPRPIRLARIADDPRSAGFPAGHPEMRSFLGVPIRVRGMAFGNLYLAGSTRGEFTAQDEELVLALAGTAAVAIENARLYEEAGRRQDWLQASNEVTQRLLSSAGEDPLQLIARQALRIAGADLVMVVLPAADGDTLVVDVATGQGADGLTGSRSPLRDTLAGQALATGRPVLVTDPQEGQKWPALWGHSVSGPVMVLPLGGVHRVLGALMITRVEGRHAFTRADLEMASTFANHATVALELAAARADQQVIARLEDRNRIARDLHDHVIQRLFAIGLTVQSVASGSRPDQVEARLNGVVTDLDETIRQTRTSIFQLRGPLGPATGNVRGRLLAVATEVAALLGFPADVRFAGPVEALVSQDVAEDLEAVLREALTNTARHAQAHRVGVELTAAPGRLCLEVTDDGQGIGTTIRRSGLDNLRQRAENHGGVLELTPTFGADPAPPTEGTCLRWIIPLT
jgi:signal transduction histidine kinase